MMQGQAGSGHQTLLNTPLCANPIDPPTLFGQQSRHGKGWIDMPARAAGGNQCSPRGGRQGTHSVTFRNGAAALMRSPRLCCAIRRMMPSSTQFAIKLEPP